MPDAAGSPPPPSSDASRASAASARVARAREGDAAAWDELVGELAPWLRVLARRQLAGELRKRLDPADVVQDACLAAHRDLASFRGTTEAELAVWMRRILERDLFELVERHVVAQRRSVRREGRSLDASRSGASGGQPGRKARELVPSEVSSPSRKAMRGEGAIALARALEELPEDQREAVRLRHVEGLSLAELAEALGGKVGCSRAVTNNGWRPHSDQVGQTGTRIAPTIYIASGISGATQHWVGAMGSKNILAINTDPEANMVTKANWAVLGDLHEVIPAITEEVRKRKG